MQLLLSQQTMVSYMAALPVKTIAIHIVDQNLDVVGRVLQFCRCCILNIIGLGKDGKKGKNSTTSSS